MSRRPPRAAAAILAVTIAAGALFSVSFLNNRRNPASGGALEDLVRARQDSVASLEAQNRDLQSQIDQYAGQSGARAASTTVPALAASPVVGPGVEITLTDAPADQAPEGASPNDLVIHQQDIEDVMNALWSGGAEAMTVQGARITSRTVIRCIGNVILVDGTSYSPPYVVQAIGDPGVLRETVMANPRIVNYQAYVARYGLGWDMREKDELRFPPAATDTTLNYAHVEAPTNG